MVLSNLFLLNSLPSIIKLVFLGVIEPSFIILFLKLENFETTQEIDEEIYESFSTD